ncbi:Alpha/Beta hydrolase protein [Mycena capillaripes]|nr:Alpha/Beta hydrolase protein [Mycena capillaripes]
MSQYAHLSTPDPEFKELIPNLLVLAHGPMDIAAQREQVRTIVTPLIMETHRPHLPAESSYRLEDRKVIVDGGEITVRCIQPIPKAGETGGFPVLVYIHGGAFVTGDLDVDDFFLRTISVDFRISIVNVDYRLAPEHPFPTGVNDCYAALKWTASNTSEISGALAKGFLVGGLSAGGSYVAAVTHRARYDLFFKDRKITGHILQVPTLLHPLAAIPEKFKADLLSMEQNKDAPMLSKVNHELFYDCLKANPSNLEVSPLLLSHEDIPPAYIQICGLDPLRDEGLLYERLLRDDGIQTKLDMYPGLPHGFHAFFPQLAASRKWDVDFRAGLGWLLAEA